jgi:hypothetical protein
MAEVDEPEIDRDLLAIVGLRSQLMYILNHPYTILYPSIWMEIDGGSLPVKGRVGRALAR